MTNPTDIFDEINHRVRNADTGDIEVSILFRLSGDDGGDFFVSVAPDRKGAGVGLPYADVALTVDMSVEQFVELAEGRLDAGTAFMNKEITMDGDLNQALTLQQLA